MKTLDKISQFFEKLWYVIVFLGAVIIAIVIGKGKPKKTSAEVKEAKEKVADAKQDVKEAEDATVEKESTIKTAVKAAEEKVEEIKSNKEKRDEVAKGFFRDL